MKRKVNIENETKLSDEELKARTKKTVKCTTSTTLFERDPYVSEYAKKWAKGICHLCEKSAQYKDKEGQPYLHTLRWLSKGGKIH